MSKTKFRTIKAQPTKPKAAAGCAPSACSPTCPECVKNREQLDALLKRLDVERHGKGSLVMWPGTDMRWYAATVAVAGLLQREIEISKIETILFEAEVRTEGDIVGAVKRLADKMWANTQAER